MTDNIKINSELSEGLANQDMLPDCQMAYIKQETINFQLVWAMYDSDGNRLGHTNSKELAMALLKQNDCLPHTVH